MTFYAIFRIAGGALTRWPRRRPAARMLLLLMMGMAASSIADVQEITWSAAERPLNDRLSKLRDVPDDRRGEATVRLAQDIKALPASANKLQLAVSLAAESTEGDYGGHHVICSSATTPSYLTNIRRLSPVVAAASTKSRSQPRAAHENLPSISDCLGE